VAKNRALIAIVGGNFFGTRRSFRPATSLEAISIVGLTTRVFGTTRLAPNAGFPAGSSHLTHDVSNPAVTLDFSRVKWPQSIQKP